MNLNPIVNQIVLQSTGLRSFDTGGLGVTEGPAHQPGVIDPLFFDFLIA